MNILEQLIYVEPNEEQGYNFGFFIKISNKGLGKNVQLIGECNNCGITTSTEDTYTKTLWQIEYNGLVCKKLQAKIENSAIILPCFPRPIINDEDVYTHMLTSQAIKPNEPLLKRVDKQFANMVNDAKIILSQMGFAPTEKIIMTGFSASSKFAQRFALLYPEMVNCVIAGGMSAVPCLPQKEYFGKTLNFPLGINDYQELMEKPFDFETYKTIKQFLFMGDLDENDPVKFKDCFTQEEQKIIYEIFDENLQKRWIKMVGVLKKLSNPNIHTYLISGVAHSPQGVDKIIDPHLSEIVDNPVKIKEN